MLGFAEGSFFDGLFGVKNAGKKGDVGVIPPLEPRGRLRSAVSAHEPPAKSRSLDEKEEVLGWWLPSDCFYFFQAACTHGVETDTILGVLDVLRQF
jgi:hypothetical protein